MRRIALFATTVALSAAMSCLFAGVALAAPKSPVYPGSSGGSYSTATGATGKLIGKKQARKLAFADAGVKKKNCSDVSVALRRKSGKRVYLVAFVFKYKLGYNYTINAKNGRIVSYYTKAV